MTTKAVNDLLLAYDPAASGVASEMSDHSGAVVEVQSEMTGGADTYFEDFSTGLRELVASQRSEAGSAGAWFGGGGANPVGLIAGVDWMADIGGAAEDPAEGDATGAAAIPPAKAAAPSAANASPLEEATAPTTAASSPVVGAVAAKASPLDEATVTQPAEAAKTSPPVEATAAAGPPVAGPGAEEEPSALSAAVVDAPAAVVDAPAASPAGPAGPAGPAESALGQAVEGGGEHTDGETSGGETSGEGEPGVERREFSLDGWVVCGSN